MATSSVLQFFTICVLAALTVHADYSIEDRSDGYWHHLTNLRPNISHSTISKPGKRPPFKPPSLGGPSGALVGGGQLYVTPRPPFVFSGTTSDTLVADGQLPISRPTYRPPFVFSGTTSDAAGQLPPKNPADLTISRPTPRPPFVFSGTTSDVEGQLPPQKPVNAVVDIEPTVEEPIEPLPPKLPSVPVHHISYCGRKGNCYQWFDEEWQRELDGFQRCDPRDESRARRYCCIP